MLTRSREAELLQGGGEADRMRHAAQLGSMPKPSGASGGKVNRVSGSAPARDCRHELGR